MLEGSLAIWCDTDADGPEVEGRNPCVELHFNMWRDLPKDVLDVGILFKDRHTIQQLYLYVPGLVSKAKIADLSDVLMDNKTLSAVFNDTLSFGPFSDRRSSFAARRANDKIAFWIAALDLSRHLDFRPVPEDNGTIGTVIEFTKALFKEMDQIGDYYIRFRIHLDGPLEHLFSNDFYPNDAIFVSAFYNTDIVEFRLNERRNFGEGLRKLYKDNGPVISAVYYILIRDVSAELMRAHAPFHKMRRLEQNLWSRYLSGLSKNTPDHMMIYHWRVKDTEYPIDDFIALTSFRKPRDNLWVYISVVLLVGIAGNALASMLTFLLPSQTSDVERARGQGAIALSVLVVLWATYLLTFGLGKLSSEQILKRGIHFLHTLWQKHLKF